jgi:hypothetical protein
MSRLPRLLPVLALAALAWAATALPAPACPFCTMQGQTLTSEVGQASMVLFGTLKNAKLDPNGGFNDGTTDLVIETVIKSHETLGDKKVITLNRYVPTDGDSKFKFLVFCDVFKGKVDPYRGMQVKADSDIARYLTGALKIKDKDINTRLRYFFDYLDDPDVEVSNDAYKEFGNAGYADYRDMAKTLPPDKIAGWLRDPNTPSFRFGLYASMLGHCGKEEHAKLLRSLLDDPEKRVSSGLDGILAGYTLLKPKEGSEYLNGILKDASKDFTLRYAALRTVRFFWDSRTDVLTRKELLPGVCELLEQADIADLAIEDLRKWQQWQVADKVLGLKDRPSHNVPIIRRAILRFALSCPGNAAASTYVAEMRKKDARMVSDAEELLKLEGAAAQTTTSNPQTATPITK